ncbi:MAG: hypothetical protein E7Z93_02245 [Cyanobacteria bacterium SIG32]|nr:hypothetical protein [Cyanobacteria bacterium SIG32]
MTNNLQNQNNTYYETLDENFNQALSLFENDLPHSEIINLLQSGNIAQKQIAALKIEHLNSTDEAIILAKNLVGHDGKIREATSLKLLEFVENNQYINYFYDNNIYNILLNAIIDVNSNVCRNIISAISILQSNSHFTQYFCPELIILTKNLIEKVKQFDFQDGKYKVNKEVFKLYWCLETIYVLIDHFDINIIKTILIQTCKIDEYTIREKTAKILSKNFSDPILTEIRNILKNDKNYYVRRF